jgi:abortive phage resistance protein AbiGi (putative antitoxin)
MNRSGYVTDDLVHFVGARAPGDDARNWNVLKTIVRNCEILAGGEHPRGATVLRRNLGERLSSNTRYLPAVTCFADIPHDQLEVHTRKYGRFGIALPKSLLIPQGVRAVFYLPRRAGSGVMATQPTVEEEWDELAPLVERSVIPMFGGHTAAEPGDQMRIDEWIEFGVLAFVKFFDDRLEREDPENFYMEREWRSVSGIEFKQDDVAALFVASGWQREAAQEFPGLAHRIMELP